ncbi:hypothetical protein JB92DRAFT_3093646 [Gautieria morchelliformis]|nr:hypothetical protein JB92DRAFT_3093646 [Gautieria morchelliformis]
MHPNPGQLSTRGPACTARARSRGIPCVGCGSMWQCGEGGLGEGGVSKVDGMVGGKEWVVSTRDTKCSTSPRAGPGRENEQEQHLENNDATKGNATHKPPGPARPTGTATRWLLARLSNSPRRNRNAARQQQDPPRRSALGRRGRAAADAKLAEEVGHREALRGRGSVSVRGCGKGGWEAYRVHANGSNTGVSNLLQKHKTGTKPRERAPHSHTKTPQCHRHLRRARLRNTQPKRAVSTEHSTMCEGAGVQRRQGPETG